MDDGGIVNGSDATRLASRRSFLRWGVGALGAAAGLSGAAGLVAYLTPPSHALKKVGGWRPAVPVAKLRDEGIVLAEYFNLPVFLTLHRDELRAYSAICPHLGCLVHWDPEGRKFPCPCHASVFGLDGAAESGPARSLSLVRHQVKVQGETVMLEMPEPAELDRQPSWLRLVIRSGG